MAQETLRTSAFPCDHVKVFLIYTCAKNLSGRDLHFIFHCSQDFALVSYPKVNSYFLNCPLVPGEWKSSSSISSSSIIVMLDIFFVLL